MHDDGYFDEAVATQYDRDTAAAENDPIPSIVALLAELAGQGQALEFAIGTGRIALPLAARGVSVAGIELSRPMIERLRAKPGGETLPVRVGDMAKTRMPGEFTLVYLVFNTINNLVTQDAQIACFENAAAHLAPGGAFLVEVGVPPLQRLPLGETLLAFERSERHWGVDEIDVVSQRFTSHHLRLRDAGFERQSIPFRYVWPSELDLMARIAGLKLVERWSGWMKQPFTNTSTRHISVWRKPAM
ncbi:MAG: class I SAM-dependent methyltransferase [Pseudomonadota bacterium]